MKASVILLALFAAVPVAHAERVSSGPSRLRAPDLAVLGRDTTIEIESHALPDGARFVTSVGELEDVRREGATTRATLRLPAQRFPQLAIIAVVAQDGGVVDWLALPLAGQANTRIATNRRAEVFVRVADREFGPVQADDHGIAVVPIIVPPGVGEATSMAKSAAGEREQHVSLGVRPFQRTFVICSPAGDRAHVIAAQPDGSPSQELPAIAASAGSLTVAERAAAGVFSVRRTTLDANAVEIRASFAGEESVAASCELQTPPAGPISLDMSIGRTSVTAGTKAVQLRITPHYAETARELAVSSLAVETEVGAISKPMRGDDGAWTARWDVTDVIGDRRRARIVARASAGASTTSGELAVELLPDEAATLAVQAPQRARGDGRDGGVIDVRLRDRFGNPVDGAPVELWRGRERLATVISSSAARFVYTAPRSHTATEDVLVVRVAGDDVESRTTVALDPLPGPFSLAASAGVLMNFGRVTTPLVRVDARLHLGVLRDRLSVHASIGGYTTTFDATAMDEALSSRLSVAPLLANVAYDVQLGALHLRVGAGAGVAVAWSQVSSASTGTQRTRDAVPAATAFVGVVQAAGPGYLVGDVGYLHATLDGMLAGRVGGLVTTLGYAIDL